MGFEEGCCPLWFWVCPSCMRACRYQVCAFAEESIPLPDPALLSCASLYSLVRSVSPAWAAGLPLEAWHELQVSESFLRGRMV